jgi:hypothetical protein
MMGSALDSGEAPLEEELCGGVPDAGSAKGSVL